MSSFLPDYLAQGILGDDPFHTLDPVGVTDLSTYDCVVTNDCGSVTTDGAALTLGGGVTVTQNPQNVTACLGESATFSVTATGPDLTYQWRKNGVAVAGATQATFTIDTVTETDAANYLCVVSSSCGTVFSEAATLEIATQGYDPQNLPLWNTTVTGSSCVDGNGDQDIDIRDFVIAVNNS